MKFEGKKYKREKAEIVNSWLASRNKPAPADPATDEKRFAAACSEARARAYVTGYDMAVFKSDLGFYFLREAKWCEASIEKLYVAKAEENK